MTQMETTGIRAALTPRTLLLATCAAITVKIVILFVLAVNTRFVMDEFWQFGQSKYLFNGFFETIWPAKAVGYAVFYEPSHWLGWDAQSMLLFGRLQTALLGCGTIALIYAIARSMDESRLRALVTILVLLCFSTFMERIFRTRSEPLALFFAAAALYAAVGWGGSRSRHLLIAGVLSGLAFLATQKAAYFNLALGLALSADALLAGSLRLALKRGLLLVAGWTLPIILYCIAFGGADALVIARNLVLGPVEVATRGSGDYGGLWQFILQTLLRNAPQYLVCFAGLALALRHLRELSPERRIALVFTVVMCLLVFLHNQPWPYVFIMVVPFLALWAPTFGDSYGTTAERRRFLMIGVALLFAASSWRNYHYLAHDNEPQRTLVTEVEHLLDPTETYFDGIGMLPNRYESTRLWMDQKRVNVTLEEGSNSVLMRSLLERPPKVLILTYRIGKVASLVLPVLKDRYVKIAPNILVTGQRLTAGTTTRFQTPVAGTYALYDVNGKPMSGQLDIDGTLLSPPFDMTAGPKNITLQAETGDAFLLPAGLTPLRFAPEAPDLSLFDGVYGY